MSMKRPRYNLGRVTWIGAEAVGVPGQRTFRLAVQAQNTAAQMWLEKEQLQALAEAIARLVIEIDAERSQSLLATSNEGDNPRPGDFPSSPEIDFQVGALGLRYDPQRKLIALEVYDREAEEGDGPALRCLATAEQMERLQANSLEVISAGRPRCPLCGAPLTTAGMSHFCPPTNGHQKLTPGDE